MAIETINVGTSANDGTGDTLRGSFIKCNDNFSDLDTTKQDELVSGTNIQTINGNDILSSGDLSITLQSVTDEGNVTTNLVEFNGGIYTSDIYLRNEFAGCAIIPEFLTEEQTLFLPDSSGTIATNESIELGVQTNNVITPSLSILDSSSGYSSNIVSGGFSGDWELLTPDSSGTIATEENVNTLIEDAVSTINIALETKQYKLFSLQKADGIVSVTGTFSETQVFRQSFSMSNFNFGANAYGLGFFLNIYSLFTKIGTASGYTIRVKLSTSSTMPSGTTDQIAVFNGTTTNLYAQLIRNFSIIRPASLGNMQIHGFPFTTSAINDFAVSTTATTSRDVLFGDTYYLYVSVQLTTTTSDTLNFISLKASNV
jgi:hypothetical protein